MKPVELKELEKMIGGKLSPVSAGSIVATGVAFDTRELCHGDAFFALIGERDGHDFITEAIKKGASVVVISKPVAVDAPSILVGDTLEALGEFAYNYRRKIDDIKIIAITGSLGKTTTREAISHVLKAKYDVFQSKKNYNNLIGLPLSILSIEDRHDIAVLELGINLPGEMDKLARITSPTDAVFLNIAPVHIEGLGDLDGIAKEKLQLLKYIDDNGKAFLNLDDERLMSQNIIPAERIITFGFSAGADYRIENFKINGDGSTAFTIDGSTVNTPVSGIGAAYSAACAWAVGREFGISEKAILERLGSFEGLPDRLMIERIGQYTVLIDSYNSSPVAVEGALQTLTAIDGGRKIAVLGDMLELGDSEIHYHSIMGETAAKMGVDALFLFGKLSGAALEGGKRAGMPSSKIFSTGDIEELAASLLAFIRPEDVILVKGSRSMRMERVVEKLREIA